jgi:hypothetical protein
LPSQGPLRRWPSRAPDPPPSARAPASPEPRPGLGSSGSGGGPLGGFVGKCRGGPQLLDLYLVQSQPHHQGVLLRRGSGGGGLCGRGAVLRGLLGGFKGRPRHRLAHHCHDSGHSSHHRLHLHLGPLRAELADCARSPLTKRC